MIEFIAALFEVIIETFLMTFDFDRKKNKNKKNRKLNLRFRKDRYKY